MTCVFFSFFVVPWPQKCYYCYFLGSATWAMTAGFTRTSMSIQPTLITQTPRGNSIQRAEDGLFVVCDCRQVCRTTPSLYEAELLMKEMEQGYQFPYSTGFQRLTQSSVSWLRPCYWSADCIVGLTIVLNIFTCCRHVLCVLLWYWSPCLLVSSCSCSLFCLEFIFLVASVSR